MMIDKEFISDKYIILKSRATKYLTAFRNFLLLKKIDNPFLKTMIYILLLVSFIGYGGGVFLMSDVADENHLKVTNMCFSSDCFVNFKTIFEQPLKIFNGTTTLLVSISTIGGILVALLSYINSLSSSRLSNHIAHFKVFQDYVSQEISKFEKLSIRSFNIFKWYNTIFDRSRVGSTTLSEKYRQIVSELDKEIRESNKCVTSTKTNSFSYKQHQKNMKQILSKFGISVSFAPRNDFFEIESELFELITNVNREFCYSQLPELSERFYI